MSFPRSYHGAYADAQRSQPLLDVKRVFVFVDVQSDRLLQNIVTLCGRFLRAENISRTMIMLDVHVVPLRENDASRVVLLASCKIPSQKLAEGFDKPRDLRDFAGAHQEQKQLYKLN